MTTMWNAITTITAAPAAARCHLGTAPSSDVMETA